MSRGWLCLRIIVSEMVMANASCANESDTIVRLHVFDGIDASRGC